MSEPQLLQLRYLDDPWRVLVCCVLLNRTQRKQVERVVDRLFADFPSAEAMAHARTDDLRELLRPLGFSVPKAQRLVALSNAWISPSTTTSLSRLKTIEEVSALPGVGKYATDCYRLLVLHDLSASPEDEALKRWAEWKRRAPHDAAAPDLLEGGTSLP